MEKEGETGETGEKKRTMRRNENGKGQPAEFNRSTRRPREKEREREQDSRQDPWPTRYGLQVVCWFNSAGDVTRPQQGHSS